jgi:hypothetical protein
MFFDERAMDGESVFAKVYKRSLLPGTIPPNKKAHPVT